MIALVLAVLGLAALAGASLLLRRVGPRYRVGRLLAAAPQVSLADAQAMARDGTPGYVRVHGRISSDEEFPDDHDRPLVYRRRRVEVLEGGRWRSLVDDREAVPFGVEERGAYVAVDAETLDVGLVVISREADGVAADLPEDLRSDLDPQLPSRLVIEQVSAVEHAFVAGVPTLAEGQARMGAGLGRPLVLTTLELGAAMRVLARGRRREMMLSTLLIGAGLALLVAAGLVAILGPLAGVALAQETQPPIVPPGDPRSEGEGPGFGAGPLLAALVVVALGLLAAAAALAYTRLAGRR